MSSGTAHFDVAVVGAGPAGLAAAVHAADAGLAVALVDAGVQPGGQFWRHPDESAATGPGAGTVAGPAGRAGRHGAEAAGHHDWKRFVDLRSRLRAHEVAGSVSYLRSTQVWLIESGAGPVVLHLTPVFIQTAWADTPGLVRARHVILCPGGYDRQLPVPGWDLPGVMAAGGVQALLKGSRTAAGDVAVVAGTGPFLLPVAAGLAAAGVKVAAICEANSPFSWLKNLRGVAHAPGKAAEGAGYAAVLARHRIPYRVRTAVTEIHGTARVEAVTISRLAADGTKVAGTERRVSCGLVALGWGFTAQLELVLAAGAETAVDVDGSLIAVVDDRLRSSARAISVAGEATGVGGAAMAVVEGELAALCVAADNGRTGPGANAGSPVAPEALGVRGAPAARIADLQRQRTRLRAFAVAMHRANPIPARWTGWLTPETVVCRCEEVTYGSLCSAHTELGADDARSLKSLARPGMGWCQGRVCGFATAEIAATFAADSAGASPAGAKPARANPAASRPAGTRATAEDLRAMGKRTLAAPITLGQLAALTFDEPETCSPDEGPRP
ncbi:FAD-dependent oxidoreductase [Specibacter sp. AOP5-B1-6]|uniref:FAD-dependent oxidoreductase n=1 Tax=Specibacter sp. AOP5-B1-6 TaxID=3457653 RepID=UPI00402B08A1